MCGICGVYGLSDKGLAKRMADTIAHRGPDGEGFYVDDDVSLGHRRLSIIDLKTGGQPIFNEDRSVVTVYNGEIYNYPQLKKELEASGHKFYTKTDTEVLVHAYEQWGDDFVKRLNGIFAFALWDSGKKRLLLSRDRMGVNPLYYALADGKLFFGSEIKAILEYEEIKRNVDIGGISSFLMFGSFFGDKTPFAGIRKVLPGHTLIVSKDGIEQKKHKPEPVYNYVNDENALVSELRKTLATSVTSQMIADVPVGAFLSGGIDSSTVVAYMSRVSEKLETFTVGFGRSDDELAHARLISDHFGTNHHEKILESKDVIKLLPTIVWHYDEPIWDAANVPTYAVSKLASESVKVVLTGEGGDELFAGYNRYKFFSPNFGLLPDALKAYAYNQYVRIFPNANRMMVNPQGRNYAEAIEKDHLFQKKTNPLERVLAFEQDTTLPNQLLVKTNRASMACGLEARVPLLDNSMVDFSRKVPPGLKMNGFNGKYVLKKAATGIVPAETVLRKKKGFGASAYQWFTESRELMDYARNVLDKPAIAEFVKYSVPTRWGKQRTGRQAYQLWSMMLLELWHKRFIEGETK